MLSELDNFYMGMKQRLLVVFELLESIYKQSIEDDCIIE